MMLADLNPAMTMMGVSQVPGHISHGHAVYSNTMTGHHTMDKTVSNVRSDQPDESDGDHLEFFSVRVSGPLIRRVRVIMR